MNWKRKTMLAALAVTTLALACVSPVGAQQVPPPSPAAGGRWADWREQLRDRLDDPAEVARWGRNDQERAEIVQTLRTLLDDPAFGTNRPYTQAQLEAIKATAPGAGQPAGPPTPGQPTGPPTPGQPAGPPVPGQPPMPAPAPAPSIPPPPGAPAPGPAAPGAVPGSPMAGQNPGPAGWNGPAPDPYQAARNITPLEPGTLIDKLYNADPDRGEMPSKVAEKEGIDQLTESLAQRASDADDASATDSGDPLADRLNSRAGRQDDSGSAGPPPPDGEGPCTDRTGTRSAPPTGTRPGTIFTPTHDSWVVDSRGILAALGASGSNAAHTGELQVRSKLTANGMIKQFKVEAHVIDSGSLLPEWDILWGGYAPLDFFHSHVFVSWLGMADAYGADFWGDGDGIDYEILCYADDLGLEDANDLRRGYAEVWIPMTYAPYAMDLSEPGFQIRAITTDHYLLFGNPYSYFLGSDMRTVHLGPEPQANNETVDEGLGLTLDDSFLEDKDSSSSNDVESSLEALLEPAVSTAVNALDGTSRYLLGSGIPDWGWLGFTLSKVGAPGSTDVEWSTTSTTRGSSTDDERLLKAKIEVQDVPIQGIASLPVAAAGLVPCAYWAEADIEATLTMGLDRDGRGLAPDATFTVNSANIHDLFVVPVPLGCNWMYLLGIDSLATGLIGLGDLTPFVADGVDSALSIATNIPTLSLPTGGGLTPWVDGYERTCDPYGCDGSHAGDVAVTSAGAEAAAQLGLFSVAGWLNWISADFGTGLWAESRFPVSYRPSTAGDVTDGIRSHTTPDGDSFSAAAVISPTLLNQALATLTEGSVVSSTDWSPAGNGLLDISSSGFNSLPRSAPVFIETPGYDLGLFLPNLEFDLGASDYYALNLFAGVDVELSSSETMEPSVTMSDVAAGLHLFPLRCSSVLWLGCVTTTALVSGVANTLGTSVLPTLLEEPLALFEVPELSAVRFSGGEVHNVDGNLVAYLQAG